MLSCTRGFFENNSFKGIHRYLGYYDIQDFTMNIQGNKPGNMLKIQGHKRDFSKNNFLQDFQDHNRGFF